ncbi:MAG: hypothetical protein U0271_38190 [Polyangiaceae bacterium]
MKRYIVPLCVLGGFVVLACGASTPVGVTTPGTNEGDRDTGSTSATAKASSSATASASVSAAVSASASASTSASTSATPSSAVAECRRETAANPSLGACRWSIGQVSCGGILPDPTPPNYNAACICNGCDSNQDCAAGEVCMELPSNDCVSAARVCVKARECEGSNATCKRGCLHDGSGHGGCIEHLVGRP